MTTSSNPISMGSLATIYAAGLATGTLANLMVNDGFTTTHEKLISSIAVGAGALTVGAIWKMAQVGENTKNSSTEKTSVSNRLPITIFSLGAYSGFNPFQNKLPRSFFEGFGSAGLALVARAEIIEGKSDPGNAI